MLHCIFSSSYIEFCLKKHEVNTAQFNRFRNESCIVFFSFCPVCLKGAAHSTCTAMSLSSFLWEFSFELLKNSSHWCKLRVDVVKTLYTTLLCVALLFLCIVLKHCPSNKFGILVFEEAFCFWLHWETVLYLCLLEADGFKGDLTKKKVLLCSPWQKDTNWQIEKLMLPEVAIFF